MRSDDKMGLVRSVLTWGSRRRAMLFVAPLLLLLFDAAQADPYDAKATEGELQTVCHNFSIDEAAVLTASCNAVRKNSNGKEEVYGVSKTVDVSSKVADECMNELTIRVTESAVYLDATCRTNVDVGGGKLEEMVDEGSQDLNEWVVWDSAKQTLTLK